MSGGSNIPGQGEPTVVVHYPEPIVVQQSNNNAPANQQNGTMAYANSTLTKQDFPTIMTRGKVVEGRLDIELEKQGSIFGGRDEKNIIER